MGRASAERLRAAGHTVIGVDIRDADVVAAVIAAAAAEHTAGEGNLSDRQLLFRIGDAEPLIPERTPARRRPRPHSR